MEILKALSIVCLAVLMAVNQWAVRQSRWSGSGLAHHACHFPTQRNRTETGRHGPTRNACFGPVRNACFRLDRNIGTACATVGVRVTNFALRRKARLVRRRRR